MDDLTLHQVLLYWSLPGIVTLLLMIVYMNKTTGQKSLLNVGELVLALFFGGVCGLLGVFSSVMILIGHHSDAVILKNKNPKKTKKKGRK